MHVLGYSGLDAGASFAARHLPTLAPRERRIMQGFDSAAALLVGGEVAFAAAEERFTRDKATGAFPVNAMRGALAHARLDPSEIDVIAHGFDYAPVRDLFARDSLLAALYDEVFAPERQTELLERHFPGAGLGQKLVGVPHHLAHAASAFYTSGFDDALILVSDAMGEAQSASVIAGSTSGLEILAEIPALHSLGSLYSVFTLYLGFDFNLDEYKVMGLAPYGDPHRYFAAIMSMVHLEEDGTYVVPLFGSARSSEESFTHRAALRAVEERFGPPRSPEGTLDERCRDIAAALQAVLQTCQLHVLRHFRRVTGLRTLCLAGGVALNCTANGVVRRSRLFRQVFVQPAAGDDGTALGAALYVQQQRDARVARPRMATPLWGPAFDEDAVACALEGRTDCSARRFDDFDALAVEAAQRLAGGEIIGWFQGRMEFGPRALGSRSILADPRPHDMRSRVNMRVKKREGFRPFAPAVIAEAAARYFEIDASDEAAFAHMLFVMPVRDEWRARLPAITHVDGSARLQTVARDHDPRFWRVLQEFGRLSGIPILLNTSFNVRGQPIVCTPEEAIDTFLAANLDALVIGCHLVTPARA